MKPLHYCFSQKKKICLALCRLEEKGLTVGVPNFWFTLCCTSLANSLEKQCNRMQERKWC